MFEGDSYRAERSYLGAHDRGCGAEEPGEGKSFTPGSEAAAGGAIPPLTVTIAMQPERILSWFYLPQDFEAEPHTITSMNCMGNIQRQTDNV